MMMIISRENSKTSHRGAGHLGGCSIGKILNSPHIADTIHQNQHQHSFHNLLSLFFQALSGDRESLSKLKSAVKEMHKTGNSKLTNNFVFLHSGRNSANFFSFLSYFQTQLSLTIKIVIKSWDDISSFRVTRQTIFDP